MWIIEGKFRADGTDFVARYITDCAPDTGRMGWVDYRPSAKQFPTEDKCVAWAERNVVFANGLLSYSPVEMGR